MPPMQGRIVRADVRPLLDELLDTLTRAGVPVVPALRPGLSPDAIRAAAPTIPWALAVFDEGNGDMVVVVCGPGLRASKRVAVRRGRRLLPVRCRNHPAAHGSRLGRSQQCAAQVAPRSDEHTGPVGFTVPPQR